MMLKDYRILVVEDETSIADAIEYALNQENFLVTTTSLGKKGLDLFHSYSSDNQNFSLVILDVGLPDISGFEVCKTLRETSTVPIIFLTARSDEIDRVVGLEIGADDYLCKPFSPRELVARVKTIFRRIEIESQRHVNNSPDENYGKKEINQFSLDEQKQHIFYQDSLLDLTQYEYGILKLLLKSPNQVFSREQVMLQVWANPEESFDRVVDTHIKSLRAKLKMINAVDESIKTHRGMGYSYRP